MDDFTLLKKMLLVDEGLRLRPYRDGAGYLSIGIGRNLDENGISEDEAMYLFENDCANALRDAFSIFGPHWERIDPVRRAVILDMLFNLGRPRFIIEDIETICLALTIQGHGHWCWDYGWGYFVRLPGLMKRIRDN